MEKKPFPLLTLVLAGGGAGVLLACCCGGPVVVALLGRGAVSPPTAVAAAASQSSGGVPLAFRYEVDLWREYENNEAAGDAKCTGKTVEFVTRGRVEKDDAGLYYIGADIAAPPPPGSVPGVVCYVAPADLRELAAAKKGQAFKVRGICKGMTRHSQAWKGIIVTVKDCRILGLLSFKNGQWAEEPTPPP